MTIHEIIVGNSKSLEKIEDGTISLIVTSPPYPMIEMWDKMFGEQNPDIAVDLENGNGLAAFQKMHDLLDEVWKECDRVLSMNGFVCINIGDATRTLKKDFQLFSNHSRIISTFINMGYSVLPDIHWRKQSNAPNKFMGSGMYPAGAYVTYEHEYILVFRKGGKRVFKGEGKALRQKSAYFWEERNVWFSDLWDIKGTSQIISTSKSSRERSAAFPFEIPYRLINMYSAEGDTVLDPFVGIGTSILAAMAANRNSVGVEIDKEIANLAVENINATKDKLNSIIDSRLESHRAFIDSLPDEKKSKCYHNELHNFPVKTKQETAICIDRLKNISFEGNIIRCDYE